MAGMNLCSEETPHRKGGGEIRDTEAMRRSFRTRKNVAGWVPRVGTLSWYAMPRQGIESETWLGGDI